MEDLTNILQHDDELNEEQLKKYLSGNSSTDEMHTVEKQMADSAFINDAVEGLQTFSSAGKLDDYVHQLNNNLYQHLQARKHRKEKRRIRNLSVIIIAVIVILLLCVLAFFVIKMQHEKQLEKNSVSGLYLLRNVEKEMSTSIV